MERIGRSDALYHDAHHTALVVLVAQDILRGRLISHSLSPKDWLHSILAALFHDIGYVRGVCRGDHKGQFVRDVEGHTVTLLRGASDAALAPYHIDRSKIVVRERFADHDLVDAERLDRAIELTRFPVPEDNDHTETDTEAGLLRAIDQLGILYPRKLGALFRGFKRVLPPQV